MSCHHEEPCYRRRRRLLVRINGSLSSLLTVLRHGGASTLAVVKAVAGQRGETLELWDLKTKAVRHSLSRDGHLRPSAGAMGRETPREQIPVRTDSRTQAYLAMRS